MRVCLCTHLRMPMCLCAAIVFLSIHLGAFLSKSIRPEEHVSTLAKL